MKALKKLKEEFSSINLVPKHAQYTKNTIGAIGLYLILSGGYLGVKNLSNFDSTLSDIEVQQCLAGNHCSDKASSKLNQYQKTSEAYRNDSLTGLVLLSLCGLLTVGREMQIASKQAPKPPKK